MTQENGIDPVTKASLQAVISGYRSRKYLPVIFASGTGDLKETTAELLRHNR